MARRTARKSRKRRRRSRRTRRHRGGGPGVAANASEVNFDEKPVAEGAPVEEVPADEAQEGGKRKRRRRKSKKRGGGGCGLTEEQTGGKRRKTKKQKGGKRKLNAFFKAMLEAKKSKAKSFSYKGKTYVGKQHKRLGMIYKKK